MYMNGSRTLSKKVDKLIGSEVDHDHIFYQLRKHCTDVQRFIEIL